MAGLALVRQIQLEVDAKKTVLAQVDFTKTEAPLKAVGLQNEIRGLNRAIDLMVEIANFEEAGT